MTKLELAQRIARVLFNSPTEVPKDNWKVVQLAKSCTNPQLFELERTAQRIKQPAPLNMAEVIANDESFALQCYGSFDRVYRQVGLVCGLKIRDYFPRWVLENLAIPLVVDARETTASPYYSKVQVFEDAFYDSVTTLVCDEDSKALVERRERDGFTGRIWPYQ